ncbi:unnamed protein product [Dovyalis caffra]|uniref:Zinc finger LSD1-type domain-containing protein n=1 Tax=Dovyalis caffra TaxID=77055 RepID=A0AAV1SXG3_9ROSI|nr:unnamed protein product [Dovyalis caffra]
MQSQVVCRGCRSVLLYPSGAPNVCCALCSTVTSIPPPGTMNVGEGFRRIVGGKDGSWMDMAQLICGGCRTLLMYTRGATTAQDFGEWAKEVLLVLASFVHFVAHVNCGNCRTTLMYPNGAPSVKCAMGNVIAPHPANRPNGVGGTTPSTSMPMPHSQTQTVVVENPMSVDESGKLV